MILCLNNNNSYKTNAQHMHPNIQHSTCFGGMISRHITRFSPKNYIIRKMCKNTMEMRCRWGNKRIKCYRQLIMYCVRLDKATHISSSRLNISHLIPNNVLKMLLCWLKSWSANQQTKINFWTKFVPRMERKNDRKKK